MSGFDIPAGDSNSNKIENVPLVPTGMNLCILYGVADLGTQSTKFGNKRQIKLMFEFPLEKRVFWEGDEPKPSVISTTETMSLADKANLRKKFIEPMIGRKLAEKETYDPTLLLGKNYVATISHSPDGQWANIVGISPLDDKGMRMFDLQGPMQPSNGVFKYHLNDGFTGEGFANLPRNVRSKIRESVEGEQHEKSGGKFAEPATNNNNGNGTAPGAPGTSGKKLVMKPDSQYTYEVLKQNNWTDEQIVEHGHATWQQPTPPPAPQAPPAAPQAPQAPAAPTPPPAAPAPPQAPPTPPQAPAEPKLVLTNPGSQPIEEWLAKGWTAEMMVSQGHAKWVK